MSGRHPGFREEDTWFSRAQLERLERADEADALGTAVPTSMVSNGEHMPAPQTPEQKAVETRLAALADGAARRLGMSRRAFLKTPGGLAASFLAMNAVFGRLFDVDPLELIEPAAAAENGPPSDLFVFDDQLHMIRDKVAVPRPLRALAQGPGKASDAAGFKANPFNPNGWPDELGSPWSAWTGALGETPNDGAQFHLQRFVKDVYLDSHVTVGLLSNAPLALFVPPGASQGIVPRTIRESLESETLTGYQTAAVRDFVNALAGSTRLLAHGQIFPGVQNLDFMQMQIEQFHPDSWKGYTIAYTAKSLDDASKPLEQWRLDDEKVAYPTYELIQRNRQELQGKPGFFNICIHKGLSTNDPNDPRTDVPTNGNPDDIAKAARDWPELNFIIYHASWAPIMWGSPTLADLKKGAMREGVPDIKWVTRMAQSCAALPNVYADLGTTYASTVTTFPTVWAHIIGQLMKYWGPDRICFGSDSLWYGSPQWQIEAFWRYQIPEPIAAQYGYPLLTEDAKRRILGLNSARLYGMKPELGLYRKVPADYASRVPEALRNTLADKPGWRGYTGDALDRLKSDYAAAGGRSENLRYGWVRRS